MEFVTVRQPVRSYVIRAGRLTTAQRRALDSLWPRFGLDLGEQPVDWNRVFGRRAPRFVEVGFGNGEALLTLAEAHPERDYVGIDVHPPGVGRLLAGLALKGLENVRLFRANAVEVFGKCFVDESLDMVYVWFPDPWPKKRHQKRRLIQRDFVSLVAQKLVPGGRLHLATDWEDYADQMLRIGDAVEGLLNSAGQGCFLQGRGGRPVTHFERRGERLGHAVWDLIFEKPEKAVCRSTEFQRESLKGLAQG